MIGHVIQGKFIKINYLNDYFAHVVSMLLEHFDNYQYNNTFFVLGTCNFISASEIKKSIPDHKVVVYQLEQLMGGCGNDHLVNQVIENIKPADEIWDYDILNIEYLKQFSIEVKKLVPLLYTKKLDRIVSNTNPEFDVLFYGWLNDRRGKAFLPIQRALFNKAKLIWIYGESELDKHIANSKIILNLHAYEPWNRQEQVRMFYPVINGKAVASEASQINYMENEILESNLDQIGDTILYLLENNKWESFGLEAKEKFKQRTLEFLKQEE